MLRHSGALGRETSVGADECELKPLSTEQQSTGLDGGVASNTGLDHGIASNDEPACIGCEPLGEDSDEIHDVVSGLSYHRRDNDSWSPRKEKMYSKEKDARRTGTSRWASMTRGIKSNVSNFFGVGDDETIEMWKGRVERMHATSKLVGSGYKPREPGETPTTSHPLTASGYPVTTPGFRYAVRTPHIYDPYRIPVSRQTSRLSVSSAGRRLNRSQLLTPQTGKESVFRMAFDGFLTLATSAVQKEQSVATHNRSFVPQQITRTLEISTPAIISATPGILPTPGQLSALDMPSTRRMVTPTPDTVFSSDDLLDDVFYDEPTPTSAMVWSRGASAASSLRYRGSSFNENDRPEVEMRQHQNSHLLHPLSAIFYDVPSPAPPDIRPSKPGWQPGRSPPAPVESDTPGSLFPATAPDSSFEGMTRINAEVLEDLLEVGGKRQIGKGFAGFLTDAEYRFSRIDANIQQQMVSLDDHRPIFGSCCGQHPLKDLGFGIHPTGYGDSQRMPYFTYWVTVVQIICYLVSVSVYGISSIGFSFTVVENEVLKSNLAIEKAHYLEDNNMWIGPRQADLIHLGAKYSPCMRRDENVERAIDKDRQNERETACCIRNDRSGCVQASRNNCSATLATWKKWNMSFNGRSSGTVCGLDYRFCRNPPGDITELWPNDITKWPVCQDTVPLPSDTQTDEHMVCKIQGRPCCIGIQGECIITTREHCTFLRGYFHQESTLCSQVSCMSEICGMIPFANASHPDQFYRLFISLFIHVGLLQLLITVVFQFFVMRDLEKLTGTLRISIIYIASGIAGSLSSAIFLPYHVEAGPTGSQFGLLACLFVEVIQNWYILRSPVLALLRLGLILLVLFIVGLLPMVDNYAHLVGFFFGFLLAFAFLPYITFNVFDRRGKVIGIVVCLVGAVGFLVGLFALFYIAPLYNCPNCHYFNCLPITKDFCRSMMVEIGRFPWYS